MTDLELIKRVRAGHTGSYEDLVIKYEKRIYGAVMSMTGNREDSLDIVQNVFLKGYINIGNFNEEASYYTYLFKIAINECKDYWKKASHKDVSLYDEDGNALEVSDSKNEPSKVVQEKELTFAVNRLICGLEEPYRSAVILRCIYRLTYAEIAERTGVDIGTVKSRLYRGREKVRLQLIEEKLL